MNASKISFARPKYSAATIISMVNTTARIAEMLVQGNTRGMVKSMQNLRAMGVLDPKVSSLSTRLMPTSALIHAI